MKPRPIESTPEEIISALPVLRQDAPTITGLRAELRLIRRLIALPMIMGICGVGTIIGIGGLMMALMMIFPALASHSEHSGKPDMFIVCWLLLAGINFGGAFGLPVVLPLWIDRRIKKREATFCDTQLIGDLIDHGQAIMSAGAGFQRGWYAGCVLAWLKRLLPEINAQEAAALTDKQRDFLANIMLTWQSSEENLVLAFLRSAPLWGDLETLTAVLKISRTSESETIRAAAQSSLAPLQMRLQTRREDAALIHSLGIPAALS